jgi:hypothetical protein
MQSKQEFPINKGRRIERLEGIILQMAQQKICEGISPEDYKTLQERSTNYGQIVAAVVDQCMTEFNSNHTFEGIGVVDSIGDSKETVRSNTIEALNDAKLLAENEHYAVSSSSGFINATHRTAQAGESQTGFKFHVSVNETPDNLARAWSACHAQAAKHNLRAFKMVEGETVDDKKGRQVTVYLHPPAAEEAALAERVPEIIRDFAYGAACGLVLPDSRGMPDDCAAVPGSRYISYRGDYFNFEHAGESYDEQVGDTYLSQDHIECAKFVIAQRGSSLEEEAINRYIEGIPELHMLDEENKAMFRTDMRRVLAAADSYEEPIPWHNLKARDADQNIGAALAGCRISPGAMVKAEYQSLRSQEALQAPQAYAARAHVVVIDEPLAREALESEEERERPRFSP